VGSNRISPYEMFGQALTVSVCFADNLFMTTESTSDFRTYLFEAFQERRARNSAYSLRAFARDLKLSPSRLNDVLKGRYGLSPNAARGIAKKLNLTESEVDQFCNLVMAKHSRIQKERKSAAALLEKSKKSLKEKQIDNDQFKLMSDWYHLAILELVGLRDRQHSAQAFSMRLGESEDKIQDAIDRLMRLGLLRKEEGGYKAQQDYTMINAGLVPSRLVRRFHSQIMSKAMNSVEGHAPETRLLNTLVLAVEKDKLPRAQELINEFKKKFNRELGISENATDVYALSIQYFSLTQKGES